MNQPIAVKSRIQSIDVLRGIVMIIMALDHVRDFFHVEAFQSDPLDPATTNGPLYFTRWITHFCAPVFVFLAGTSAYLAGLKKDKAALSKFLITRGLWLILIEIVVITLGITFNPFYNAIILQVIWAIGISMVLLGFAVRLPYAAIFAIGAVIVLGHNLLDYPEAERGFGNLGFWWDLVHGGRFSFHPFAPQHGVIIVYPFLAWTGIMLLGYCAGRLFRPSVSAAARRKNLLLIGSGLIVLFLLLRFNNGYGDPAPWRSYKDGWATFFSFMNVTKYPPSLMYSCITLGPALLLLALIEKTQNRFTSFAIIYGRVPFFYYVVHFYIIHILTVIAFFLAGYGVNDIAAPNSPFFFRPVEFGYNLFNTYLVWISVVLLLYLPCRWYNRYKASHTHWWLSYV